MTTGADIPVDRQNLHKRLTRSRVLLGIVCLAFILWSIKTIHHALQPKYQGKTAKEWFDAARFETNVDLFPGLSSLDTLPAALALRAMRTNAVSLLWYEYQHGESLLLAQTRMSIRAFFGSRSPINLSQDRAYQLLNWLGPDARQLVPELLLQTENTEEAKVHEALELLQHIHSEPGLVIPKLMAIFQDEARDWRTRSLAAKAVAAYGPQAAAYLPAFRTYLADPKINPRFKKYSAMAILQIAGQDEAAAEYLVRQTNPLETDWIDVFRYYQYELGPSSIHLVPAMITFAGTFTNAWESNAIMGVVKEYDPHGIYQKP